jgi:hypothetical protein
MDRVVTVTANGLKSESALLRVGVAIDSSPRRRILRLSLVGRHGTAM